MKIMKTPKLLPWYARKAGVPIERAEVLWVKAVRRATDETGWVGNAEFWGASMDIFRQLLEAEKASLCAPRVSPLLRLQRRLGRLPLLAFEDLIMASRTRWLRSGGPQIST
jgi:hypothetical protein